MIKKLLSIILVSVLCLSLSACEDRDQNEKPDDVVGDDWRVTGIVRDSGIITRNGKDTNVLVCINNDSADFYLDEETQTLYDYVNYPITLQSDPWEGFQGIDFSDRNGDNNSDVTMLFESNGQQLLMVWFWDTDTESYVFRSDESQLADSAAITESDLLQQ